MLSKINLDYIFSEIDNSHIWLWEAMMTKRLGLGEVLIYGQLLSPLED